jgi:ABC-type sugar transport system permease subunit
MSIIIDNIPIVNNTPSHKLMDKILKAELKRTAPFLKFSVFAATPCILLFVFVFYVFVRTISYSVKNQGSQINFVVSGDSLPVNKHSCFLRNTVNRSQAGITFYVPEPSSHKTQWISLGHCGSLGLRSLTRNFVERVNIKSENDGLRKFENEFGGLRDFFDVDVNVNLFMYTHYRTQEKIWVWKYWRDRQEIKTTN